MILLKSVNFMESKEDWFNWYPTISLFIVHFSQEPWFRAAETTAVLKWFNEIIIIPFFDLWSVFDHKLSRYCAHLEHDHSDFPQLLVRITLLFSCSNQIVMIIWSTRITFSFSSAVSAKAMSAKFWSIASLALCWMKATYKIQSFK